MCKHTSTELKPLLLTTTQHAVVTCHAHANTGSKAGCPGLFECDMAEATAIRTKQPIKVGLVVARKARRIPRKINVRRRWGWRQGMACERRGHPFARPRRAGDRHQSSDISGAVCKLTRQVAR